MSPGAHDQAHQVARFPRVSGDEPEDVRVVPTALLFSPRERG